MIDITYLKQFESSLEINKHEYSIKIHIGSVILGKAEDTYFAHCLDLNNHVYSSETIIDKVIEDLKEKIKHSNYFLLYSLLRKNIIDELYQNSIKTNIEKWDVFFSLRQQETIAKIKYNQEKIIEFLDNYFEEFKID